MNRKQNINIRRIDQSMINGVLPRLIKSEL